MILETFSSPIILFFVLGLVAGFAKSDLAIPEAMAKAMAELKANLSAAASASASASLKASASATASASLSGLILPPIPQFPQLSMLASFSQQLSPGIGVAQAVPCSSCAFSIPK